MGEGEIRTCDFRPQRSSPKRESDSDRNARFSSTTVFELKIETESERQSRLISVHNGLQRRGLDGKITIPIRNALHMAPAHSTCRYSP